MHKTLNRMGYIIDKTKITEQQDLEIRKELEIKPFVIPSMTDIVKVKPINLLKDSPKYYVLPRHYGVKKFGQPEKIQFGIGKQHHVSVDVRAKIQPHQKLAYKQSVEMFKTAGGGILCLPCGYGKTVLGIILALKLLKLKTLVIVHKEFLKTQWIERIEMFSNARVGIIQGSKIDTDDKDIVIGMLQSISMKSYSPDLFSQFGLVIIDEVHHIGAEVFSRALPKIATKFMLGLSATPRRSDKLEDVFKYYIGDIFHREKRCGLNNVFIKFLNLNSELIEYSEKTRKINRRLEVVDTITMHTQLSQSKERNCLITYILRRLFEKEQRKVLVLSMRIDQLLDLKRRLQQENITNPDGKQITFGLYIGKQPKMNKRFYQQMLKDSEKCDIVLATINYASEALDIPDLNTLVLCSSLTDVEQASGRILRRYHADKYPMIIDIVDKCGNFVKHFRKRQKYYSGEGYNLMYSDFTLEDVVSHNGFDKDLIKEVDKFLFSIDLKKYPKKRRGGGGKKCVVEIDDEEEDNQNKKSCFEKQAELIPDTCLF
jgi:superfamily II DNA or RNA helicase